MNMIKMHTSGVSTAWGVQARANPRSAGELRFRKHVWNRLRRDTTSTNRITSAAVGDQDTWMVLTLSAALTQSLEATRVGSLMSAPLIAIVVGAGLSCLGIVPVTSPVYDTVSSVLLPLGVALYVLEVNVFSRESSRMLLAFLCGAFATCVGTVVSYALLSRYLSVDGINIATALCASYIGGSVNFAAVIAALGTNLSSSVPAAMAADNLMMGAYIAVLMWISTYCRDSGMAREQGEKADAGPTFLMQTSTGSVPSSMTLSAGIAAAFVCSRFADILATRVLGFPSISLALVSVVACVVSPLASRALRRPSATVFSGSISIASICMTLFFVSVGAIAGSGGLGSASALPLFAFVSLQLAIQLSLSLGLGKLFELPLPIVLIACNANVGGAATAVAMCIAKKWTHLINAALLVASLGYIIGNPIAFAVFNVLKVVVK